MRRVLATIAGLAMLGLAGIANAEDANDKIATVDETTIVLEDGTTRQLAEIINDPGGRGFDMRFGGHRDNIPEWHSGCVVCLYSCPGSKVGNASYTVRDFVNGATHFEANPANVPAAGSRVTMRLRLETGTP